MAVTIHVNGKSNSLVHKGSMGIVKSTLPDVCKTPTPAGPVPIPYPIIVSMSSNLKKGTKTVKVDGKKMAAVKGSNLSCCTGDEPGTVGGIKSSTNMKEATWILYSFDVKMDGKNACRLTDKLFMNHGNTVCLSGIQQQIVLSLDEAEVLLCAIMCECKSEAKIRKYETSTDPALLDAHDPADYSAQDFDIQKDTPGRASYQQCVERKLKKDYKNSNLIPEQAYNMETIPPTPVPGMPKGSRIPDIVRLKDPTKAAIAPNIDVIEMKFWDDDSGYEDKYSDVHKMQDKRIGGGQEPTLINKDNCKC